MNKKIYPPDENQKSPTSEFDNENKITSLSSFLDLIKNINEGDNHNYIYFYRGHADKGYNTIPSVYRNQGWIENEDRIFKDLIIRCPDDFKDHKNTFQSLVKMQHYSLPTRLLDITSNPLIALYFACEQGADTDGEVIIFKIHKSEIKYYDSDTVSVISNIAKQPLSFKVPTNRVDTTELNSKEAIRLLIHEIRAEKPHFQPNIIQDHLSSVVCVKPLLENARITSQHGAFLLFGINEEKAKPAKIQDCYIKQINGKKTIISKECKTDILALLESLGIYRCTIYPEIDNVSLYIKDLYKKN